MSLFFSQKPFDSSARPSQSLCNDRCQNILFKAVFEHFKNFKDIAVLLLASKSFQNSSFGANFLVNFVVNQDSILLLHSVLSPSSCFSLQFAPSLSISIENSFKKIIDSISNFVGEIVKTKYLHLSLRSLTLEQVNVEIVEAFFGGDMAWLRLEALGLNNTSPVVSAMLRISEAAPHLTNLALTVCPATDDSLEQVSKLSSLTSLILFSCPDITGAGLQHISTLSRIESLILSGCSNVGDLGLENISTLSGISTLWLDGAGITDNGLQHITALFNITNLDLNNCDAITDVGIEYVSRLSNLNWLALGSFCDITDVGLEHLSRLSNLETLTFSHLRGITDAGIEHLSKCSKMVALTLGSCCCISDGSLQHISKLSFLEHLDVTSTDISDVGLQHLVELPRIKLISVHFCKKITDVGLEHLSPISSLTSVGCSFCANITDAGLSSLGKLPNISRINVYGCEKITASEKKLFKAAHPDCDLWTG